jgi:hypothetical protein
MVLTKGELAGGLLQQDRSMQAAGF